jgi:hypothetical protein
MQKLFYQTFNLLLETLQKMDPETYVQPAYWLDKNTIGNHTRHILELLQCLQNGYPGGVVNYDNRKRNKQLETDIVSAKKLLKELISRIWQTEKQLLVETELNNELKQVSSGFERELLYNIEHCTHHMALIKVALKEFRFPVHENFGVAASTQKYRNHVYHQ